MTHDPGVFAGLEITTMTKESLIWLVIRSAGLVFGYLAIMQVITFVTTYLTLSQTMAMANTQKSILADYQVPALTTLADRASNMAALVLVGQFLYVVIYGVIAGYLLRGGKLVFDILNVEEERGRVRRDVIDTLHLGDS